LRVLQPSDRKASPVSAHTRPPRRPAFHNRHTALGDIRLNADLITHLLRYPPPAPSLHTSNVRLRQTRHAPSLPTRLGQHPSTRPWLRHWLEWAWRQGGSAGLTALSWVACCQGLRMLRFRRDVFVHGCCSLVRYAG